MGTRILIVDDDAAIRTLLMALCRRLKYESDMAADGIEALEKIDAHHFDLVLLDLMMPRMNGYQVIEALRKVQERPPVIVLTAHGDTRTAAANVDVVNAVLRKPFDVSTLITMIGEVLGGAPAASSAGLESA